MGAVKYFHVGKVNFYNGFVYVGDFVARGLFVGLILFIFIQLWTAVYAGKPQFNGFTMGMIIWYMVMTEAIVTSFSRVIENIGEEIRSGEVANYLNKPYHYLFYKYSTDISAAFLRFFVTFVIGSLVVIIFVGEVSFPVQYLPLVLVCVFLSLTLHFALMAFLGVFAFWMEDSKSLYFLYQKFVFVIGGMLIPLEFFPVWLGKISSWLPFSYIAYFPAKTMVMFEWMFYFKVIGIQLLWISVVTGAAFWIYSIGAKRVSINGG